MRILLCVLLTVFYVSGGTLAQESYNNCVNAQEVCPNTSYTLNNINANVTFCPGCEDDFIFCFTPQNSIWLSFTTNATGGDVQVNFSNLVFELSAGQDTELQASIIQAIAACDASTYTQLGNCLSNESGNFSLLATGLAPSTTYYVVIDGDNTGVGITEAAQCTFDVFIAGVGVDRPASSVLINPNSATICLHETATFTASVTDCPDTGNYQWFINGILVSTTTVPNFQTSALQNGDVVSVQTSCYAQCPEIASNTTGTITVNSFPISAGPDQTINSGESAVLGGATTATSFQWTPTFNVSNPSNLNPIVAPTQTTTYTLTATQNGCTLTDQATITVSSTIDIPNSFSPNGDGANDTWVISGAELFPDASMTIYTRWGQPVFQSRGYNETKAWDGTNDRGKPQADGVYYYVFDLKDSEEQVFKGSVTLIR